MNIFVFCFCFSQSELLSMHPARVSGLIHIDGQVVLWEICSPKKNSLENPLRMSSPRTACFYGPATFNNDKTWFKYMLHPHLRLWQICWQEQLLRAPSARKQHTTIFIGFFSRFPIFDTIRLIFPDSTHMCRFN